MYTIKMFFVIPSLSRVDTLIKKSLSLLLYHYKIPAKQIHIFVVAEEADLYRVRLLEISPHIHLHIGPLGLHHMRNFIHTTFPEGVEMICMDDDITDLKSMTIQEEIVDVKSSKRYPLTSLSAEAFQLFLTDAFQELRKQHLTLFGIYPVRNGYFMKDLPEKTYNLRFIVGCIWGCINRHDILIHLEEKEDVERTILYFIKDKGVLRYNRICPVTNYYKEPGGMQRNDILSRKEASQESCMYLINTFPTYCKLYTSKKSGIHEIRFING